MAARSGGWRRNWGRGALAFVALVAPLLLAELVLRLTWEPEPPLSRPPPPEGLRELKTLFDIARANVTGVYGGVFFRTNSAGIRGPEYSPEPAVGIIRIILAGDSVTMGAGVLEQAAYPARLEARLNAGEGSPPYEVINLGLAGLRLEKVVDRLEGLGLRFHPDIVVYGFTVNDIEGPDYRELSRGPLGEEWLRGYLRFADSPSLLVRLLWPRWMSLRERIAPVHGSYVYDLEENYFRNPTAWADFLSQLDRLQALGAEHGFCVHVLIHPHLYHLGCINPLRRVYQQVAAAARERGMTVTEALPAFQGRDAAELRLAWNDPHPNPAGHALLAQVLYEGLQELPAECWASR